MHHKQDRQILPLFSQTQIPDAIQPKSARYFSENLRKLFGRHGPTAFQGQHHKNNLTKQLLFSLVT